MNVIRSEGFRIEQKAFGGARALSRVELAIVFSGRAFQIEHVSAVGLKSGDADSGVVEFCDAGAQFVAARNLVEDGSGVIVLRFHPGGNLGALEVLEPAVRIDNLGSEIVVRDFPLGCDRRRQRCRGYGRLRAQRDAGEKQNDDA